MKTMFDTAVRDELHRRLKALTPDRTPGCGKFTAPELLARAPAAWNGEVEALGATIDRFAGRTPSGSWLPHPAFGRLSGRAWGVLSYRHMDHHFRQFGI
jgi:hypothetical protein